MGAKEEIIKDAVVWFVIVLAAQVVAIQDADFHTAHGCIVAAGLALGILATSLKSLPTFGQTRVNVPAVPAPSATQPAVVVVPAVPPAPAA